MSQPMDPKNPDSRALFLVDLDILEKVYSVPVNEREALLIALLKEKGRLEEAYLGHTDKTGPELATELIKKGIKAKSYVKPITKKGLDL